MPRAGSAPRTPVDAPSGVLDWWDDHGPAGGPLPAEGLLGEALRAARYRAVLSQKELAARSGVTQSVISRMERGERTNWQIFCRLLDALDLEPAVTTRRRTSDLEREAERLSGLTAAQRLAEHQFFIDWLPDLLPPTGWALDGDVARLAHGMPVVPERYSIAVAAEVAEHELVRKLRERWDADFEIRTVAELPPIVHVEAGGRMVPLLPLAALAALAAVAAERGTS